MRHPSGDETKRHMLQQDGCTGDAVFLVYKTVRLWGMLPCMSTTRSFSEECFVGLLPPSQEVCTESLHI